MRDRAPSPQSRALLAALAAEPLEWRHGYDLAKAVGLSSGTLYPILIRLHERGYLEARWTEPERAGRPARHAYRLSQAGLSYARRHLQAAPTPAPIVKEALA
jgi:PadR family transcriptional regulator, regulatory protein PadR